MEEDINGISIDDYVLLHVENENFHIKKSGVIRNFWEHRTRTLLHVIESGDNDHLKVVSQKNIPYVLSIIVQMSINY